MKFVAIIPARYASTRFPGKPLALLGGKPVIQHVVERVGRVIPDTIVATDDERIMEAVAAFGGQAIMTGTHHRSGTDRCREALDKSGLDADVVVNVQGDEPFIATSQLEEIIRCFDDVSTQIATLVQPFAPEAGWAALSDPNSPKVVVDDRNFALYFSRSVIPYLRGIPQEEWLSSHTFYKHIGLYAYRADVLRQISGMPQSALECAESLEQLRWLQAGLRIKVGYTNTPTIGIDTPEDLAAAEAWLQQQPQAL